MADEVKEAHWLDESPVPKRLEIRRRYKMAAMAAMRLNLRYESEEEGFEWGGPASGLARFAGAVADAMIAEDEKWLAAQEAPKPMTPEQRTALFEPAFSEQFDDAEKPK